MSRMATNEYIGSKRRLYATADREKRIKMLDEVCETTGYERKYANRLLTGSRKFRERKGRGKTYGEGTDNSTTNQRITIVEKRRLSVQYLANQKTPSYLHSVFSI